MDNCEVLRDVALSALPRRAHHPRRCLPRLDGGPLPVHQESGEYQSESDTSAIKTERNDMSFFSDQSGVHLFWNANRIVKEFRS
jgi:hypothetical protein